MAMNGAGLKAAIKGALNATGLVQDTGSDQYDEAIEALASAIVDYVTTNAVVPPGITVSVDPMTGIGATSGPGSVT